MPARYESIKHSLRSEAPNLPEKELKTRAAKIYNATRKPNEPALSPAYVKREKREKRRNKKKTS